MTISNVAYYAQLVVLICNALICVWLFRTKLDFKLARGIILSIGSFLLFLNLGNIDTFTAVLCLIPFLTSINISNADINNYSASIRGYIRKLQDLYRNNSALSQKKES